jgi:hypothetical protein
MPNIINNVDLDKIGKTIESGKKDKLTLLKPVKLYGKWNLDESKGYQFRTELSYENGKEVIEIDSPSFLGGNGSRRSNGILYSWYYFMFYSHICNCSLL